MVSQDAVKDRPRGGIPQSDKSQSIRAPGMEEGWWSWSSGGYTADERCRWWSWAATYEDHEARSATAQAKRMTPEEAQHRKRRITRLRKGGMFDPLNAATSIERAVTIEDLTEAYALVHDAYVEKGYMVPNCCGVRIRPFEALPEMATFVAKVDGKIVAVTSIVPDSPDLGLPSDHVYREDIDRLRQEPGTVFEITNLAVAPECRNGALFLHLTRAAFAHARAFGSGNIFISVSPGHTHFFQDVCQFEPWGARRSYSDEVEDIVQGMRLCIPTFGDNLRETDRALGPGDEFLYDFYYPGNPYHDLVEEWAGQAQDVFEHSRMLRELFLARSRFLLDCSDEELDAVNRRWGDRVYWSVWGEPLVPEVSRNLQPSLRE